MGDDRVRELVEGIAAELEATAELPVERTAARWIGEAEAVAADLRRGDPDPETIARRTSHVLELLENVDDTGHAEADDHVATAESLAADVLCQLE